MYAVSGRFIADSGELQWTGCSSSADDAEKTRLQHN